MSSAVQNSTSQSEFNLGYGKSLPVQSVQEMVKKNSTCVPDKYIREQCDRPKYENHSIDVPVIDIARLSGGQKEERLKMELACKEWGFFQIVNHGIAEEVLQKMKIAVGGFFDLSLDEKKKYAMAADDIQGYGQAYVVSEEQKPDWGDMMFLVTDPEEVRQFKYWPTTVTGFREAVEVYNKEVKRVACELLANMSLMMNMRREDLIHLHREMKLGMRFNYYPLCSRPDLVLGVAPHSDCTSITILLQDDDITGLQIRHKGSWVPVKPIPNALVVNIGDVIEGWSNGMYRSIEHRAITNDKKARISVATFLLPEDDVDIGPVDESQKPRAYKNIKYVDYLRYTLAGKMDGKSKIEFLKLNKE